MAKNCPQCGAVLPPGALAGLCPVCLLKQGAAPDSATQPEAKPFEPPPVAKLGGLFPQLQILGLLGKGGMGAVYKARQPALDRFVALKILPAQNAGDSGFAERFTREARALARLSHPNIVAVHEFGQVDGLHFFIMEFVDGVNLRQLEKTNRLSPREALQIIPQICDALQYAHDEGVVHRDIKPENVLVDRKGRVKIADFGLAKMLGRDGQDLRLTGEGQVMGTPHYMAPEQIERPLEVDHRADIFSLGVVFYEMLTGELPLGKFAPPSRKVEVDVRLDEVVLHALEKEPARRYQQASQVKTEVQRITGSPAAGSLATIRRTVPRWALGVDYKSKATLWGLPLVHVASGPDPETGKRRIATGILAIGNVARGLIAIGGVAVGGIALGGCALGVVAFGGAGIGLLAFGGLAIGLLAAVGGGAIAPVALGGGAIGYWAFGGGAWGANVYSGLAIDPAAWDFFEPWQGPFMHAFFIGAMWLCGAVILAGTLVPAWLQARGQRLPRGPGFWGLIILAVFCAALCIVPVILVPEAFGQPRSWLVSGQVRDTDTDAAIQGARIISSRLRDNRAAERETTSSAGGKFVLVLRSRPAQVTVSAPGYETWNLTGSGLSTNLFAPNRHASLTLKLRPAPVASAETWSPGGNPDPNQVLEEARELMKTGKYEETLQRFIWYQRHAREYSGKTAAPSFIWVLSDWIELGRRYPKARQALLEIRDREAQDFAEGRGYFELFQELANINQYLQEEDATYATYQRIPAGDRALAGQCYLVVQPLMLKRGLYGACLAHIGDPQAAFERARQGWEMMKQSERRMAEVYRQMSTNFPSFQTPPRAPQSADDRFVGQTRDLVEILVGAGRRADAEKIRDKAVAVLDDPRLRSAVADAEQKVAKK